MGSEWVDGGPSLGSALSSVFTGLQAAPGKALDNMYTVEQIKAARANQGYAAAKAQYDAAEAARKDEEFKAQREAADAFSATVPEAVLPQRTQTVVGPYVGNASDDPSATRGLPTVDLTYTDPADQPKADADRTFYDKFGRALAFKNVKELPSAYATAQVGVGGVPESQSRKEQLQYLQTGKFDKQEAKPFVITDPVSKEVVRVYGSSDGGRTDVAGNDMVKQYGAKYQIAPANPVDPSAAPKSIFDSKGQTQNALVGAANDIASGTRIPNEAQTRVLALGLYNEYPEIKKILTDAVGNTMQINNFVEKEAPPALRPLLRHIVNTLPDYKQPTAPGTPGAAAAVATPGAAATPGAVATPDVTSLSPPQSTTILSAAPASKEQVDAARAIQMTEADRAIIEDVLGVEDSPSGPIITKPDNVPGWAATVARETFGTGFLSDAIINKLDPNARRYFIAGRSWIEPVLRIASGAVTPPQEVTGYMNRFIPDANDSPQVKAEKVTRMRIWGAATRSAANANDAINKILANPQSNATDREMAEKMRVKAANVGTLTAPVASLGQLGSAHGTEAVKSAPASSVSPRARGRAGTAAPANTGKTADQIVDEGAP